VASKSSATTVWISGSLGLVTVAVVGYIAYKFWTSRRLLPPAQPTAAVDKSKPGQKLIVLAQPKVAKGEKLSTKTQLRVQTKNGAYKYAKVTKQYPDEKTGVQIYDFTSPVDGYFTDKLLSANGHLWAEIRPG